MSALSSFWGNRSKKQKIAIAVVLVLVIFGAIGSFTKPKTNPGNSSQAQVQPTPSEKLVSIEDLKASYLSDLDNVEVDYFVADSAAFGYLKNYCQSIEDGMMPATPDAIAKVVASYCGTRLAEAVLKICPVLPQVVESVVGRLVSFVGDVIGGTRKVVERLDGGP
jgi:hypothetical protein